MKKAILTAMLVLSMATAAFAGTESDINPQRAKLEQLNKEVHAVNQDAVMLGESAILAPVSAIALPFSVAALPHRYIEAGDDYAQAIPGTVGRYAARASLVPFRLVAFAAAIPWYGLSYAVGAVGAHL